MTDDSVITYPNASGISAGSPALGKNPGVLSHIHDFFSGIFGDFYNTFRLTGYLAEMSYSELQRSFAKHLHQADPLQPKFHPQLFTPDWKSTPRMIVNGVESSVFALSALYAFHRDCKKFHADISKTIAMETGKEPRRVTTQEIISSQNPLVQTAMNRFKSLYAMRFGQPLTFFWGLKMGITATVLEIVGERAAYFERNSYDQLQRLLREANNNQWGSWSHGTLVTRLVDIIQLNRAEHKAPPLQTQEIEQYMPLLQKMADRIAQKQWRFSDAVYVMGHIIKEPTQTQKAWNAYATVESISLPAATGALLQPSAIPQSASATVQAIVARGPQKSEPLKIKEKLDSELSASSTPTRSMGA